MANGIRLDCRSQIRFLRCYVACLSPVTLVILFSLSQSSSIFSPLTNLSLYVYSALYICVNYAIAKSFLPRTPLFFASFRSFSGIDVGFSGTSVGLSLTAQRSHRHRAAALRTQKRPKSDSFLLVYRRWLRLVERSRVVQIVVFLGIIVQTSKKKCQDLQRRYTVFVALTPSLDLCMNIWM